MRRRATRMILTAVTVVVLVLGVPAAFIGANFVWAMAQNQVDAQAATVARAIDRRLQETPFVTQSLVATWARPAGGQPEAYIRARIEDRYQVVTGEEPSSNPISSTYVSSNGTTVTVQVSSRPTLQRVILVETALAGGVFFSLGLGAFLANRMSRRLSAPLIYLAAQAEQIGSGQVRAQVKASGIEEIDLVQDELVRTGERMARRLAAERQRSADASHQLRTPITALSMRLEEIEYLSDDPDVKAEAQAALAQVERLTVVVEDLMDESRRAGGETEVVQLLDVFNTEREEWEKQYQLAGRNLVFIDEAEQLVLAKEGNLTQILATLLENSLRYGEGDTVVRSRRSGSSRAILIDVSDQGQGVDADIVEDIFDMGFSGHGSSGIGLALAKDLAESMGARLSLSSLAPPTFTLSLSAIPANFDPNVVMPQAPVVSLSRRASRI